MNPAVLMMAMGAIIAGGTNGQPPQHSHPMERSDRMVVLHREPHEGPGILVIAHGGTEEWEAQVEEVLRGVEGFPLAVAFGMAMESSARLQEGIDSLADLGSTRIAAVPLFIASRSPLMRHMRGIFGAGGGDPTPAERRVGSPVPLALGGGMDDDPLVARILADRAREVSVRSQGECIALVAHGPIDDADNAWWLEMMGHVAEGLKREVAFREVIPFTLRDDAPPEVRRAAVEALRRHVSEASAAGRVIILPLLMSSGDIQAKIRRDLEGLSYTLQPRGLVPHPLVARWVEEQARTLIAGVPGGESREEPPDSSVQSHPAEGPARGSEEIGFDLQRLILGVGVSVKLEDGERYKGRVVGVSDEELELLLTSRAQVKEGESYRRADRGERIFLPLGAIRNIHIFTPEDHLSLEAGMAILGGGTVALMVLLSLWGSGD